MQNPFPLCLGAPAAFATVREFLAQASFDEPHVCAALKLDHIGQLIEPARDGLYLDALPPALAFAIRVFVQGARATARESRAAGGEAVFDAFRALGLLREEAGALVSPVWLYPVDGFLIVSDRHCDPAGRPIAPTPDAVFAACFEGTLHFLRLLPCAQKGEALDLCGGTGIGALHLSRTARRAVTSDVNARAAHFAAFNARLNGAAVESLCGDLYETVRGRQFDLISCHPPYLPAGGDVSLARDGGETGEAITRRTIEGLPAHLRPGGLCLIATLGGDGVDAPFERRVQAWLGAAAAEFAIVFGMLHTRSLAEVMAGIARRGADGDDAEAAARAARLRAHGLLRYVYGALLLERLPRPAAPPPLRVPLSPESGIEALLAARARTPSPPA
ncbi:MAG TPA: methyltransferase [Xanthobacteraceae bacterium]|nr:methyltransferase [Xanthobacteraceae bacterium]